MDKLIIRPTYKTPKIILDKEKGEFIISGRSLPEDAKEFYQPVKEWIEKYFELPNDKTAFVFEIYYFNTASSKMILDIFYMLRSAIVKGYNVNVFWRYEEEDEEMHEAGNDYAAIVKIPFQFEPFERLN